MEEEEQGEDDEDKKHHIGNNEVGFEKMLIEDERGELRIHDGEANSLLSNSTLSGGDLQMLPMVMPTMPCSIEHDRFIPQRNRTNTTLNFEAKEFLFA